jgi:hypothetical protein
VHCLLHAPDKAGRPSMNVTTRDGTVLVACHYCGTDRQADLIAALQDIGLWPKASPDVIRFTGARRSERTVTGPSPRVVKTTVREIRNRDGTVLAQHVEERLENGDKNVTWQRPGGRRGLGGVKVTSLPFYGMERLAEWPKGTAIVLGEGENVQEALTALGIPALGTVTGAATVHDDDVIRSLVGYDVVIWPDHDADGQKHAVGHAKRLIALGGRARMLHWPGAREKGDDAVDFIRRDGGTGEQIRAMMAAAPPFDPLADMRIMSVGELMALVLPEPRHVIAGIVPEGLTLVGGKSKIGKSWMTLGESIAVAAGGKALGKIDVERGEVLALTLEDTARRLQGRLEAMLGTSAPPAGLHIATEWPRADQGGLEALEAWLTVHPTTRLIVIDTWPKFRPPRAKNADAFQDDYQAATALKRIADAHPGLAIIVVIHLRKAPADDWVDSINATSGVAAAADAVSVIVRDRGRADAVLKVTGRDVEERELALTWDADLSGWVYAGPAEEFRRSQERAELLRVLAEADRPLAPREIVPRVKGKNAATVRWLLAEMAKDGEVVKAGRGLYTTPNNANKPTTPSPEQPSHLVASPEQDTPIVGGPFTSTNNHQQSPNGTASIVGGADGPPTTHQQPLPDRNGAVVGVVGDVGGQDADIVDEVIDRDPS